MNEKNINTEKEEEVSGGAVPNRFDPVDRYNGVFIGDFLNGQQKSIAVFPAETMVDYGSRYGWM